MCWVDVPEFYDDPLTSFWRTLPDWWVSQYSGLFRFLRKTSKRRIDFRFLQIAHKYTNAHTFLTRSWPLHSARLLVCPKVETHSINYTIVKLSKLRSGIKCTYVPPPKSLRRLTYDIQILPIYAVNFRICLL
jgi:hypothetical protein